MITINLKYYILKSTGQRVCLVIIFMIMMKGVYAGPTGPGSGWQYCRRITLSAATPLADFQVRLTLTTASLGNPYTNIKSDGSDLRFYDANNNPCNYWLESFSNIGSSIIWVKVPASGSTAVFMYYGNAAATAISDGSGVFEFFDDFTGSSLAGNWQQSATNGTVTVSTGNVTLSCNSNSGSAYISSAFTPASTSFVLEAKNQEPRYYRNRFYAGTGYFSGNPFGFDNGYFNSGAAGSYTTAQIFWNGTYQTGNLTAGTNYLTQWQITDGTGSTYNWNTYTYSTGALVRSNSNANTASPVRYITIGVTEANNTSTVVDWVRVRKASSTFTDIASGTISAQVSNVSASVNSQTNVLCNGNSTGSATVTASGGGTPYTYSWNTSPVQTTPTATNLGAGSYTVTVTENSIGISATASVTITQPTALSTTNSSSNINCFNGADGQITITGSGGVTPYMYSINNGVGGYQGSNVFGGLAAGQYKPRIMDANGCESKQVQ